MYLLRRNEFADLQPGEDSSSGWMPHRRRTPGNKTVVVAAVDGFSFLTTEGDGFGPVILRFCPQDRQPQEVLGDKARESWTNSASNLPFLFITSHKLNGQFFIHQHHPFWPNLDFRA